MIMTRDKKTMEGMQIALDTTQISRQLLKINPKSHHNIRANIACSFISRVCQRHLHDDLCSVKSRLSIM